MLSSLQSSLPGEKGQVTSLDRFQTRPTAYPRPLEQEAGLTMNLYSEPFVETLTCFVF